MRVAVVRREQTSKLFKLLIAAGFGLGVVLLAQTVSTYLYVSGNMMVQEARRDVGRKVRSIERAVRVSGGQAEDIPAILEDLMEEWKDQVAWIRVFDLDGKLLASAGAVPSEPPIALRRGPPTEREQPETRESPAGRVLVSRSLFLTGPPFRFGGPRFAAQRGAPPGEQGGGPPGLVNRSRPGSVEVALLLDSVSTSFAPLRIYLIVGVSAALALMSALIVIGVRFPKYLRGRQIEGQLELARRVQADLLPTSDSLSPNLDFAAECISAWDVGGDFCDVFNISDGRIAIVLGDVSGKGISAALLMALIHGAIHSSLWTRSGSDHESASRSLNSLLCKKTARERFASLFWGWFDPRSSVMRYINAGHLPPLLIRSKGTADLEVQRLESGGPVLGLLPGASYTQGEHEVNEGDLLVAFSDG